MVVCLDVSGPPLTETLPGGPKGRTWCHQKDGVGVPGCEPIQRWRRHFQAGQRRTLGATRGVGVSGYGRTRGVPGGPKAHLQQARVVDAARGGQDLPEGRSVLLPQGRGEGGGGRREGGEGRRAKGEGRGEKREEGEGRGARREEGEGRRERKEEGGGRGGEETRFPICVFQAGQRSAPAGDDRRMGLVCLDVSRYRGGGGISRRAKAEGRTCSRRLVDVSQSMTVYSRWAWVRHMGEDRVWVRCMGEDRVWVRCMGEDRVW